MGQLPSQPPGYELCFPIGSGGMATVSYGRRLSAGGFAHAVAIKQLHPHLAAQPELVSMFLDEARLAARVVHANVVSILDVVQQGHDVWAVMPYIEGESLSVLAKATTHAGARVPVAVAVAIAIDLLAGLEAAHTATDERGDALGIVHRDVSPQNVLVGADGVARVLDFGVAKAHGRLHETRDGQVKGKLCYMAPEQLGGEASVSTDVYAAAIVLWELLAGRPLFDGTNDMIVMTSVLAGAASAPSQHAPVPPALDAVVMRALSLHPARRFESAAAMSRALVDACGGAVAARTEIAAWVGNVAGPSMAERRALAQEMARRPSSAPAPAPASDGAHEATSPAERSTRFGFVSTAVMPRAPISTPPIALPPRRAGRRLLAAAAAVTMAALVALSAKALVPSASAESHRATPQPSAPSLALAAAPTATPAIEQVISPAAEPSETVAPSSSPQSARASAKAAPVKAPRSLSASKVSSAVAPVVATGPAPAAAVVEDCDPPFVVDASGMRRYKRSCLR